MVDAVVMVFLCMVCSNLASFLGNLHGLSGFWDYFCLNLWWFACFHITRLSGSERYRLRQVIPKYCIVGWSLSSPYYSTQIYSIACFSFLRLDQHGKSEVPQRELIDFEKQYDIPIIGISNLTPGPSTAATNTPDHIGPELRTTAPILNCLCERLWYRDQQEAGLVIWTLCVK